MAKIPPSSKKSAPSAPQDAAPRERKGTASAPSPDAPLGGARSGRRRLFAEAAADGGAQAQPQTSSSPPPPENRKAPRRKAPPKRRVVRAERRADMRLISAASQLDIYLWALSVAVMVGMIVLFLMLALYHEPLEEGAAISAANAFTLSAPNAAPAAPQTEGAL